MCLELVWEGGKVLIKSPKRPQHLVHWLGASRTKQVVELEREKVY